MPTLTKEEYRYTIAPMYSSGKCEVCGEIVIGLHHQTEVKRITIGNRVQHTSDDCQDLFGHKDCLIAKRR